MEAWNRMIMVLLLYRILEHSDYSVTLAVENLLESSSKVVGSRQWWTVLLVDYPPVKILGMCLTSPDTWARGLLLFFSLEHNIRSEILQQTSSNSPTDADDEIPPLLIRYLYQGTHCAD